MPDGEIAGVMLDPAAEAEKRKYQRGNGVYYLAQKSIAHNDGPPFRGTVQRPHAAGQLAESGKAEDKIIRQDVDEGKIAKRGISG